MSRDPELDTILGVTGKRKTIHDPELDQVLGITRDESEVEPVKTEGILPKAYKSLLKPTVDIVSELPTIGKRGLQKFNAGTYTELANVADVLKKPLDESSKGIIEKPYPKLARTVLQKASDWAKKQRDLNTPSEEEPEIYKKYPIAAKVAEGTITAVPELAKFATVSRLGPIGLAGLGAAREADKGVVGAAKGAVNMLLMDRIMKGLGPLKRYIRMPASGAYFGTQAAIEGGDASDIASSTILGAGMGAMGGKGQIGLKELYTKPKEPVVASIPRVVDESKLGTGERGKFKEAEKPETSKPIDPTELSRREREFYKRVSPNPEVVIKPDYTSKDKPVLYTPKGDPVYLKDNQLIVGATTQEGKEIARAKTVQPKKSFGIITDRLLPESKAATMVDKWKSAKNLLADPNAVVSEAPVIESAKTKKGASLLKKNTEQPLLVEKDLSLQKEDKPLTRMINKAGGIHYQAESGLKGELRWLREGNRNLVKMRGGKKTNSLDYLREKAIGEGLFPEDGTLNEFVDAISNENSGIKKTSIQAKVKDVDQAEIDYARNKDPMFDDRLADRKGESEDYPVSLLDEGQTVTTPLDTYKVTKREGKYVTLKDGRTVTMKNGQTVPTITEPKVETGTKVEPQSEIPGYKEAAEISAEAQRKQEAKDFAQFGRKAIPEQRGISDLEMQEEGSNLFAKQKNMFKSVGSAGQDNVSSAIPLKQLPKKPLNVRNEAGERVTITPKEGEQFSVTPFQTAEGKIKYELHDGDSYVIPKNVAQDLTNRFGTKSVDFTLPKDLEVVKKGGKGNMTSYEELPPEMQALVDKVDKEEIDTHDFVQRAEQLGYDVQFDPVDGELFSINKITTTPTKYAKYQLANGQGAKNYREVLLKSQDQPMSFEEYKKEASTAGVTDENVLRNRYQDYLGEAGKDISKTNNFKSTHWDEPNVVAHARLAEHTEIVPKSKITSVEDVADNINRERSGKQTTLLEELQSDWAREGRDRGFSEGKVDKDLENFVNKLEKQEEIEDIRDEIAYKYDIGGPSEFVDDALISLYEKQKRGIPNHPALKNWQEHGLKHAIKEAVDAGSDTLSWVTGEQTARRYDLSKQIDEIETAKMTNGDFMLYARKNGQPLITKQVTELKELEGVIGKDPTRKLIEQQTNNPNADTYIIKGDNLKVGGEWASNLYDKQIPNILKDLTKGYGTKFQDITLENGETVHSMTITPELREAVGGDKGTVGAMSKGAKGDVVEKKGASLLKKGTKLYSGIPLDEAYKSLLTKKVDRGELFTDENIDYSKVAMRKNKAGIDVPVKAGNVTTPERVVANATQWKDIRTVGKGFKDIDRQLEYVAGKDYPILRKHLIENRENATNNYVKEVKDYKDELKEYIGNKLGIKARSKESAAVQQFGEKKLDLEGLKKQFPNNKWNNVVTAEKWFKEKYDKILGEVNDVLENHNREPIKKREDYFTHFQDIWNIYQELTSGKDVIDSRLVGMSEFVKPNAPFNPYSLRRKGGKFVNDAVTGFERYIIPTLKQKHLTPEVSRVRSFQKALEEKTLETKNINNFIQSLQQYGNALTGTKTNPVDRYIQDYLIGRNGMKAIDFLSRQLGKNQIVLNLSSAVMQIASLPPTLARIGPVNYLQGAFSTIKQALSKKDLSKVSPFLERRYTDIGPVRPTVLQKGENAAAMPFKVIEQFTTTSSWFGNYYHGLSEGLTKPEAVKYADHWTRRQVGGRSIGEKATAFESRTGNLAMMFQYEVNNLVQQYVHDYKPNNFQNIKSLGLLMVYSALFNSLFESFTGRRPLPDPIKAGIDAYNSDTIAEGAGRIGGEILSSIAGGQTIAAVIPEDTRRKYMGRTEVGLYSGAPIINSVKRGFEDPKSLVTSFVTPFGGSQINKTARGIKAVKESPKELSNYEKFKAIVFGTGSLNASASEAEKKAKEYLSKRPRFESKDQERTDLKRKGWKLLKRTGKFPDDVKEAYREGKLTDDDVSYMKRTAKMEEVERLIKSLTAREAFNVYKEATPEERKILKDTVNGKIKRYLSDAPKDEAEDFRSEIKKWKSKQG